MGIFMEILKRTIHSNSCNIECIYQIKINKHKSHLILIQSNIPKNYTFSLFLIPYA